MPAQIIRTLGLQGNDAKNCIDGFISHVQSYEYDFLGIPEPTEVYFLNAPLKHALEMIRKRNGGNPNLDINETEENMRVVYEIAQYVISRHPKWHIIDCVDENGYMLNEETINDAIYNHITRYLNSTN